MRIIDLFDSVNFNIREGQIEIKFRSGRTADIRLLNMATFECFDEILMSDLVFDLIAAEADAVIDDKWLETWNARHQK